MPTDADEPAPPAHGRLTQPLIYVEARRTVAAGAILDSVRTKRRRAVLMITANDVRALASSPHIDAVLALLDGRLVVARTRDASAGVVILTRTNVLEEFGHMISDLDADALVAHHVKRREALATISRTSAAQS